MSAPMDHEVSTNQHDDFEQELDDDEYLDDDQDNVLTVPTFVRRPPISRHSVMSDVTVFTELLEPAVVSTPRVNTATPPDDQQEQPRIGIHPVSRVLARSSNKACQVSSSNSGEAAFTQSEGASGQNDNAQFAHQANVAAIRLTMNAHPAYQVDQGNHHDDEADNIVSRGKEAHTAARLLGEQGETNEFDASNDSNPPTFGLEIMEASLDSNDLVFAAACRVDSMPVVVATPVPSFDDCSSTSTTSRNGAAKPRKTRMIKKTIIKSVENGKTKALQTFARKTTTYKADGSCVETTFNADGTTTTTIKRSSRGNGRSDLQVSKSARHRLGSTALENQSTTSFTSSGTHSRPERTSDARFQTSSSESQGAMHSLKPNASFSFRNKIVKSRTTRISSEDGSQTEVTEYMDGTRVTKIIKASKRR